MQLMITNDLKRERYEKKWQFCVGSCHASTLLRADALRQLKKVHDELGIRYVRFHGIFNDDMKTLATFNDVMAIPGGEKFKERTFHRCGLVYDNILDIGMKPFVELSFMPNMLAGEKSSGTGFYGSNMSMPEDLGAWSEYIKAFITYLLLRYGKEELEKWYFEVWNEPDLQGMFFQGTKEEYFDLYAATAAAMKEICPSLKVGGPSTSGSKWVASFIQYCEDQDLPLDFVTTHQYVGDPFLGISEDGDMESEGPKEEYNLETVSRQMEQLSMLFDQLPEETSLLSVLRTFMPDPTEHTEMDRDIFRKNAKIVREQAKDYPLFYTEWNMCASFGAYSNDTRKEAAYDIRTALNTNDLLDGSAIWCYSDIFEELHQFTEEFHGGFGLLTHNGIPKPVYHGLKMLADAREEQIVLENNLFGEIEAAAYEGSDELQVLLFRQNMKQEQSGHQMLNVVTELEAEPKRVYLQRIDEDHCNPLKQWEEAGSPKDMTKAQIAELIKSTCMLDEPLPYTYQDQKLRFAVSLAVNDIYFVRIEK